MNQIIPRCVLFILSFTPIQILTRDRIIDNFRLGYVSRMLPRCKHDVGLNNSYLLLLLLLLSRDGVVFDENVPSQYLHIFYYH